jgi:hypothetical protein
MCRVPQLFRVQHQKCGQTSSHLLQNRLIRAHAPEEAIFLASSGAAFDSLKSISSQVAVGERMLKGFRHVWCAEALSSKVAS